MLPATCGVSRYATPSNWAAPPSPAEEKPTVSAASVDTEGADAPDTKSPDADDPTEPSDGVNGDGS